MCEWRRVREGALLPYHLGRLTTYAGLGALSGLIGATLARLPWLGFVSAALLLVGAALFLVQALRRLVPAMARSVPALDRAPPAWNRAIARLAASTGDNAYLLGVALGFLPCAFLYAALATAAGSSSVFMGALGMLAFGLGTVPTLMIVGVAGLIAEQRWQRGVGKAAPAVLLFNAALLTALAFRGLVVAM
jgi:sulfite exporter TauE/SafE